ncbi:MAG: hypothetical protein N3G19_00650 [Candidatus Pacearchaeota archaeon]|nr:hypothetical protein [Candidatus Pacearchaeota archaeon]
MVTKMKNLYKNKTKFSDISEIIREAQLVISDLLQQESWKNYENAVMKGNNEMEKTVVTIIKNFADNRSSKDLVYKLAEDAYNLKKNLKNGNLSIKIDDKLKKEIYKALSNYVGLIQIAESKDY